jgi:hypothetical protein
MRLSLNAARERSAGLLSQAPRLNLLILDRQKDAP